MLTILMSSRLLKNKEEDYLAFHKKQINSTACSSKVETNHISL